MRRVIIDATAIDPRGKGLSRYAVNLLWQLARLDGTTRYHVLLNGIEGLPPLPDANNFSYQAVQARPMFAWYLRRLPRLLRALSADLVHVIGDIAPLPAPRRLVMTVTELPTVRNRLQPARELRTWLSHRLFEILFPMGLRRADLILAISESTRADLIREGTVPAAKVIAAPLGVDPSFRTGWTEAELEQTREQFGAPSGYVLAFATGDGRENVELLVTAWSELAISGVATGSLVLAGCRSASLRSQLSKLAASCGVATRVVILDYVADELLPRLYAAASCYVDTSRYEGFGLHLLEAMSCGVPVIASATPSATEVGGEAALFFATDDGAALRSKLRQLFSDPELRLEMSRLAIDRAREFSWERNARITLQAYRRAMST